MEDSQYEEHLKRCTVTTLKNIIKKYMTHVKILVTGKSKSTLIQHILQHTKLVNGSIYLKPTNFDVPGLTDQKPKKEIKEKKQKKKEPEQKKVEKIPDKKVFKEIDSNKRISIYDEKPTTDLEHAYKTLELNKNDTLEEVKKAYKKLSLLYHPDKNKNSKHKFDQIQQAYDLITLRQSKNHHKYIIDEFIVTLKDIDSQIKIFSEQQDFNDLIDLIDGTNDQIELFYYNIENIDKSKLKKELNEIDNYKTNWDKVKEDAEQHLANNNEENAEQYSDNEDDDRINRINDDSDEITNMIETLEQSDEGIKNEFKKEVKQLNKK